MPKKKKAKRNPIRSDEQCVAERRATAEKEAAEVIAVQVSDGFHGSYRVAAASEWDDGYSVEIRDLVRPNNSCACTDFRINGLGTCKHVERVLQFLQKGPKRAFAKAAKSGCSHHCFFVHSVGDRPCVRYLPGKVKGKIAELFSPYFDAEGFATAAVEDLWPVLERRVKKDLSLPLQRKVWMSDLAEYWIERNRRLTLNRDFDRQLRQEVSSGLRSDNPVLHELYPYQKEGMLHLAGKGRAMLADEMGLGKTVQAIAAAELLRDEGLVKRVLVVCPASLKTEWEEQIAFFTGKNSRPLFGTRYERLRAYREPIEYLLCNYEQIRVDVEDINREFQPDLVILDEAQRIKNWPTKTARSVKHLVSPYAFVLTGTPMENRLEELFSLVDFIDPHHFGNLERFQREYAKWDKEQGRLKPANLSQLHRALRPLMLRRRKADVESNLPGRSDKTLFCGMTDEQRKRYAEFEEKVGRLLIILERRPLTKDELDRLQLLLGCMRMLCDSPYIQDGECRDCPKLLELKDLLGDLLEETDTQIIIFSEWVRMLELVGGLLDQMDIGYAEHTGKIPQKKRAAQLKRFKNDPDCPVLLASESGGVGLNLQNANVVINLDLPWNPAKLEQRIARAWRKHQKRDVRVFNLVASDSIEEKMIGKLAFKTALAEAALDGADFDTTGDQATQGAFLERVAELMGHQSRPPMTEEEAESLSAEPNIKQKVLAAAPSDIVAVDRIGENGPSLVTVRPGENEARVREVAQASEDTPTLVIRPKERALLLQLAEMGFIHLDATLTSLYQHDEGVASLTPKQKTAPAAPPRFAAEARAHWERSGKDELAAGEALLQLGLQTPAEPHLRNSHQAACESLSIYFWREPGKNTLPADPSALEQSTWNTVAGWDPLRPGDFPALLDELVVNEL
jgi:superfamily II DNA or RNA helicase